jgi:hypothetical protein
MACECIVQDLLALSRRCSIAAQAELELSYIARARARARDRNARPKRPASRRIALRYDARLFPVDRICNGDESRAKGSARARKDAVPPRLLGNIAGHSGGGPCSMSVL